VTVRLRPGLPSLRTISLVRALERSFVAVRRRADFRLVHYALQGTHAHFVVETTDAAALARGMMAVGARIARAVNRVFDRHGPVLAERFHLRVLRTPRDVRNVLAYVLLNARRHASRIGRAFRIDPASSGRWFGGWRWQPLARDRGPEVAAVSEPQTWLLRIGWRRHGLIDPDERPATGRSG
jgi:putative transposase